MGELVLKGGRVIDPSQNLDGIADVVFAEGRVKAVGRDAPHGRDAEIRDAKGLIVTPGLIDLHTHVYWGGTSVGVDPCGFCRISTSLSPASSRSARA
jgi:dihydroorotase